MRVEELHFVSALWAAGEAGLAHCGPLLASVPQTILSPDPKAGVRRQIGSVAIGGQNLRHWNGKKLMGSTASAVCQKGWMSQCR